MQTPLIFDGHNDALTRLLMAGGVEAAARFARPWGRAIDAQSARVGGLGGGLFALWAPSPAETGRERAMQSHGYDLPLAATLPRESARRVITEQMAILRRLEKLGLVAVCTDVAAIRSAMEGGTLAAVLHLEGAECLGPDLAPLDDLHAAGLRSLGPVWSRDTIFGHGVPFRFPSTPDIGPGLTDAGRRLVRRCDELGIVIDLSHMNEAGFWDVARLSRQPLVATHSAAHAICPHARNLTDRQLDAIAESGGLVGLNFGCAFLRTDGRRDADTPVRQILRHLDHLIGRLGEGGVALGSDYDGTLVPRALTSSASLPVLRRAMRDHGYGGDLIRRICRDNWLDLLDRVWD